MQPNIYQPSPFIRARASIRNDLGGVGLIFLKKPAQNLSAGFNTVTFPQSHVRLQIDDR